MGEDFYKQREQRKEDAFINALLMPEIPEPVVYEAQESTSLASKQYVISDKKLDAPEDVQTLYKRLLQWNKGCRDLFIDLSGIDFGVNDEDMYLDFKDKNFYDKRLYFKVDPEKPKDPTIIHATKQFCKCLNIPYSFFVKNRPSLKANIVRTWQAGLEALKEDKYQVLSRIRESDDSAIIRALLSTKHAIIHNHELINVIINQVKVPYKLEFSFGDEKDDLILHARFLFDEERMLFGKIPVCAGFSLVCSELGASPLILDTFLHDKTSKTSYIALYGGESFFKTKYDGIQPNEVKEIIPKMVERISQELPLMISTIEECKSNIDPRVEASKVAKWDGSNDKFRKALYHEVAECSEDMTSTYDFARHISLIAKDSESLKRLEQEKIAGKLLNFFFEKN
jgi:hypothetical protein